MKKMFKEWFRFSRVLPMLTVSGAGLAIVLALLGFVKLTFAESIIIALLALLAIDSLGERISVLEKLEDRLSRLTIGHAFKPRKEILTPIEHGKYSSKIDLLASHAVSAIAPYISFYKSKMSSGCKLRIMLLDPKSPSLFYLNSLKEDSSTEMYIHSSLELLKELVKSNSRGSCEVRLTKILLPFSIFSVDTDTDEGSMIVEFRGYKVSIDDRPHIHLTANDSSYWYNYYWQQFERAWTEATIWEPE